VRDWMSSLLQEGLSPATVKTYRQVLGQALNQAVTDGLLPANPVRSAKAPTVRPRRQLFLTADELGMLADASGAYGPLVWFLGWSGLRFGEAAALKVGNVDARRRRVRVEGSVTEVNGRLVFGPTKTHETRTVILPQFVIERMARSLEGKARGDASTSLLHGRRSPTPVHRRCTRREGLEHGCARSCLWVRTIRS
jgi:integrase